MAVSPARTSIPDSLENASHALDELIRDARLNPRRRHDLHHADLEERARAIAASIVAPFRGAAAAAPMQVVHARFGVVLSRAGGALAKMHLPFKLGLGGRLGSGRQFMSWISLEDAVAAIYWMVSARVLSGPVNVVAPAPVRNSEFTRALGRALGRPTLFPAPVFALRMALGEMADEALLSSQRVEPAKLLAADFTFSLPDVDSALSAELG